MINIKEKRKNYASDVLWEDIVGYSRAVRIGNILEISGTVASEDDVGYYEQTNQILEKIDKVLQGASFCLEDVVRTRIYVIDIGQWKEVGKAHANFFGSIKPATSMLEVAALISPWCLVEIEATAIIGSELM